MAIDYLLYTIQKVIYRHFASNIAVRNEFSGINHVMSILYVSLFRGDEEHTKRHKNDKGMRRVNIKARKVGAGSEEIRLPCF